jgi:transketolase
MTNEEMSRKARWIRRQILETIAASRRGHIGGAFSCTDILTVLYYGQCMRFDPRRPRWPERDRFLLSKGHSCLALYVILADLGFFPLSELQSYCVEGSMLGGHPDRRIPGVEADTGSLGHGLGIAAGMALAGSMDNKEYTTFALLGDGECHEGSVWEAATFAAHHRLKNLVAIVDRNRQCATDYTEDCNALEPLPNKWKSFGWDTVEVDGHSMEAIAAALRPARNRSSDRPLVIIANTIKGKGVSFMEAKVSWHHGIPSGRELEIARQELALE